MIRIALSSYAGADEGIKLVVKQFEDVLQKLGVAGFSAAGQPFDPARHEVVEVAFVFVAIGAVLGRNLAGVLAALFPARRVTRMDFLRAITTERPMN